MQPSDSTCTVASSHVCILKTGHLRLQPAENHIYTSSTAILIPCIAEFHFIRYKYEEIRILKRQSNPKTCIGYTLPQLLLASQNPPTARLALTE